MEAAKEMVANDKNCPSLAASLWRAHTLLRASLLAWILVAATGKVGFADDDGVLNGSGQTVYLRVNQVGYLDHDAKVAVAFAHAQVDGEFAVVDHVTGNNIASGKIAPLSCQGWGTFAYYYQLDFSQVETPGRYFLRLEKTGDRSSIFQIGKDAYGTYQADLLAFMRQQRCGYNPFLDMSCHQRDGRTAYGPRPAATIIDVSGGWHDAGDQLKYMITSSNATARMLLAYELEPGKFGDLVDARGQPAANGIPDILDEAKWGLDWMHKMHPGPNELYHQIADDRDHSGWKWPNQDNSDYGWGPNSYRVVYHADGKPQGLKQYQSQATGIANLAGRYAAAMAIGYRIWKRDLDDPTFADKCLQAAVEVYQLGQAAEGFQQGNSYKAPYRYMEDTWADDMEWGAAELYRATGNQAYLNDARGYATIIGSTSWMPHETAGHYQYYPFVNVGHFALYPHVDDDFQEQLASYYRAGIEATLKRGLRNPYRIGVPFIWCSNNLAVALITQIILYEELTGDLRYHDFMLAQRDWLFGRNPWGTSMFTGIPRNGEYPLDVHTSVWHLTRKMVPGGLVDGPVYARVYGNLKGIAMNEPDEFANFQNKHVVYHDDIGDYSTNEPTMDGTAGAILMLGYFGAPDPTAVPLPRRPSSLK
jgi:endoglucanase